MSQAQPSGEAREQVVQALSRLLASSYTLYLKTHNYHWNVTGPMFTTLHNLFEREYTELALAVDEIAERIRALGHPAPGSYAEFARLSLVAEAQGVPQAMPMVSQLVEDQQLVTDAARALRQAAPRRAMTPAKTWRCAALRCTRRTPGCCAAIWSNRGAECGELARAARRPAAGGRSCRRCMWRWPTRAISTPATPARAAAATFAR